MARAIVNAELCQGHTLCNFAAPDVFHLRDEDGHAFVAIEGDLSPEHEPGEQPLLGAAAGPPASGGRQAQHRSGAAALGEPEREPATQGVADEVGAVDARRVQLPLEVVDHLLGRGDVAARIERAALAVAGEVDRERGRPGQQRDHVGPHPGTAAHAVQQDDRVLRVHGTRP